MLSAKETATANNEAPTMAATETETTTTNNQTVVEESYISNPLLDGISSAGTPPMDRQLLRATTTGDVALLTRLVKEDPDRLFSATPHGNNCLHLAVMQWNDKYVKELSNYKNAFSWFLSCANKNGETPLIAALKAPNAALASLLINIHMEGNDLEAGTRSNEMLLSVDIYGDNALHHALRNGFENIGIQLLDIEPRLSEQVNKGMESALFMACRKGLIEVAKKMIKIPSCAHFGPENSTAFDAAIRFANIGVVKELLKGRPELAHVRNNYGYNALCTAVFNGRLEIVKILLEHDPHLAYINTQRGGVFMLAIRQSFFPIAKEIMHHCPDVAYTMMDPAYANALVPTRDPDYSNALHIAIIYKNSEFIDYIVNTPQLQRLINQPNIIGELPLHVAAHFCNPEVLQSLLSHEAQDNSALTVTNVDAASILYEKNDLLKTLKWNEAFTLMSNAIPSIGLTWASAKAKVEFTSKAEKEIRSLTQTYTTNTSLVAALLATITFAAAFTLPGGYSSDSSDIGLPIFARKLAFKVFLISDTLAMCSSLVVAFLCVLATWEDLDFLLNYRKFTRALMWCAYGATAVAFATGLFTVIAPKALWLSIFILVLTSMLPFLSKIIGDWPVIKLRFRLGRKYRPDLLAMVKDAV